MTKNNRSFFLFLLLMPIFFYSQIDKEINHPSIRLKSGVYNNKISLRWAVDQPLAWQKANKIGFVLTRYTLSRNGKSLSTPEVKNLGSFLPKPLNDWKNLIEKNDNAAIVAQSLYGENFEVEMGNEKDKLQSIVNQSDQLEQRFAFALMSADLDFDIAKMAGWGYTDTEVKPNEKYLYTIELNTQAKSNIVIEKGNAIASLTDKIDLPKPLDFIGIFQDKIVTLSWEYLQLKDTYTAYFIEKSTNGNSFTQMGNLPVVNMNDDDKKQARGMLYIDSLKQNEAKFSYRIRGKTIFGEYGPYSDVVSGAGKKKLEASPRIIDFSEEPNNNIKINWEFPIEAEKEISSFKLIHSETDRTGTYKTIKDNIPVNQRNLITQSVSASNYFKIVAIGKNQEEKESFATLVQPNDTTPPAVPIEFVGRIDSLGIVRLRWKGSAENDLEGYHVFRGNQKNEEMVRLTPQATPYTYFQDQVDLQNLNSKVYYYVIAMDKRKNESAPSVILELEKPDKIKPQPPVFTEYKLEDTGEITLNWQKSFSTDVAKYQLFRLDADQPNAQWKMMVEIPAQTDTFSYTDKALTANQRYKYRLIAIDKSQLKSNPSQEITLRSNLQQNADIIKNLVGSVNKQKKQIELIWRNLTTDIKEIIVYRFKANEKPTLFGTLNSDQNFLEDNTIEYGNIYTYLLKPMLKNNQPTKTEKITVEY